MSSFANVSGQQTTAYHSKNSIDRARNYDFISTNFMCETKIQLLPRRPSMRDPPRQVPSNKALYTGLSKKMSTSGTASTNEPNKNLKDLPHSCLWASKIDVLNKGLEMVVLFIVVCWRRRCACPTLTGARNLVKLHHDGNWFLKFLIIKEELLVSSSQQLTFITPLPAFCTHRSSQLYRR